MIQTGELLLGKYRIGERLGEGGMGTVFKARDELLDRDVAIKVLRAELAGQPALLERFRSEAIALARLAHPGIAALHGLERDGDQFYMVMEFARGETLEARIRREGRLPWNDAVTITAAVCDALGHAHHLGVVHRDIKPANVMVSPSLSVKVMDFGIARITGQSRQTRHGNAVGTLHYMSPEQLRGEEVDGRTDLYALGAMLYEMVSGAVPFDADSDYELMQKQLNDTPPRLGAQVPGVPGTVERLTARAMAKDRGLRFNSAAEMRAALTSSLSTPDIVPEAGTADQPQPLHLDWRTWSAGAMVVVALALVFGGVGGGDQLVDNIEPDSSPASATTVTPLERQSTAPTPARTLQPIASTIPVAGGSGALPPAPPPVQRPRGPATPPPDLTGQRNSPTVTPQPAPEPSRPNPTTAITGQIDNWLDGLARRDPGGMTGSIGSDNAASLVREGRASFQGGATPAIRIDGDNASATISTIATVRTAFGSPRKVPVTFRLEFRSNSSGQWRINSARVE